MIRYGSYKDRPAVYLESGDLCAAILPRDGAKMASLIRRRDGRELLAVKASEEYRVLTYDGSYVDAECSGFDDMFPTVDPYTPEDGPFARETYPDHGETCRIPYTVTETENGVCLCARSGRFPIVYEKTAVLAEDGGLDIGYRIRNEGETSFPFLWAGHIMLRGEDGMQVLTPFAEGTPVEMMFSTPGYDRERLPLDRLMGHTPGTGAAYKFYYLKPLPEGYFGVRYRDGSKLLFSVDPEKLPYLGIWLNNGEFQNGYSITPEPCTVPFDAPDRAAERGYTSVIPPKESFTFHIHISL